MIKSEIISIMEQCTCGTRIEWTWDQDKAIHRGVVDEYHPGEGAAEAYLSVIEPGKYIPVLGASEIKTIKIMEERKHDA